MYIGMNRTVALIACKTQLRLTKFLVDENWQANNPTQFKTEWSKDTDTTSIPIRISKKNDNSQNIFTRQNINCLILIQ